MSALVERLPSDFKVYSPREQAWYPDPPQEILDTLKQQASRITDLTRKLEALEQDTEARGLAMLRPAECS